MPIVLHVPVFMLNVCKKWDVAQTFPLQGVEVFDMSFKVLSKSTVNRTWSAFAPLRRRRAIISRTEQGIFHICTISVQKSPKNNRFHTAVSAQREAPTASAHNAGLPPSRQSTLVRGRRSVALRLESCTGTGICPHPNPSPLTIIPIPNHPR